MHHPKVIAISLQKGGVGKTTTCVNVGVALALKGKRVLLVDLDPQGHIALSFGIKPDSISKTIYDVITNECQVTKAIIKTKHKVDIISSKRTLSKFDMFVVENNQSKNPALWIKDILKDILDKYDYILIDLPPALNWLTINGLTAATGLLIPMQAELFAESGVMDLLDTYESVKKHYNPHIEILGIIITMFNSRTNLSSVITQEINKYCDREKIRVFETSIRRSVRIGEAQLVGQPAITYARGNEAVQDYLKLTEEILAL